MKYLLDTSVFLLGVAAEERLNARAQELLTAPSSELYMSVAGTWEIAIKFALGSLPLPKAPSEYIPYAQRLWRIQTLNITQEHAFRAGELRNAESWFCLSLARAGFKSCTSLGERQNGREGKRPKLT